MVASVAFLRADTLSGVRVLDMKSAALKFLAVGGIALAAYPVVTSLRPDQTSSPQIPEVIQSAQPNPQSSSKKPETALSLTSPSTPTGSTQVIIRPDSSGHFITKALINGISIPVMFDTGASIVALSYEDALKMGFRLGNSDFRVQIQTANGLTQAAEILLKEVRVGGISIAEVPAMVLPPGKLETSLLGRSFWGRLKTGFSYTAGNLVLKN